MRLLGCDLEHGADELFQTHGLLLEMIDHIVAGTNLRGSSLATGAAGTPDTTEKGSTSRVTRACATTTAPRPMRTPGRIVDRVPSQTSSSIKTSAGSSNETLYVADTDESGTSGRGLGKIDLTTLTLTRVGDYSGALRGLGAELTGTGDGRLFGFFLLLANGLVLDDVHPELHELLIHGVGFVRCEIQNG